MAHQNLQRAQKRRMRRKVRQVNILRSTLRMPMLVKTITFMFVRSEAKLLTVTVLQKEYVHCSCIFPLQFISVSIAYDSGFHLVAGEEGKD